MAGWMIRVVNPEGEVIAYGYDPVGRLTSAADSKDGVMKFSYDLAGRKTKQEFPSGIKCVSHKKC